MRARQTTTPLRNEREGCEDVDFGAGGEQMARKRMIDPNIWMSQDFSRLSTLSKLVFIGLFSQADDEGRGRANSQYVRSALFPYDDKISKNDVERSLTEIAKNMTSPRFCAHRERNGERK
jgi:hypothetical protein